MQSKNCPHVKQSIKLTEQFPGWQPPVRHANANRELSKVEPAVKFNCSGRNDSVNAICHYERIKMITNENAKSEGRALLRKSGKMERVAGIN